MEPNVGPEQAVTSSVKDDDDDDDDEFLTFKKTLS
jgi:hypothetical protein